MSDTLGHIKRNRSTTIDIPKLDFSQEMFRVMEDFLTGSEGFGLIKVPVNFLTSYKIDPV